ncbi:TPM domain-containing protein [Candidatus Uhrbacteria bacterium]|nr:TPM domain-containing protein [Candidatus Uhrbacteria bacterium]
MQNHQGGRAYQRVLLMMLGLAAFLAGVSTPAMAQDCDAVVVDSARLFGGDTAAVESAARALTQRGATVRVRTVPTFGGAGSLDHYEAAIERQCPSWQAPGGGTRNSLLVFMIAVKERASGMYSGTQWKHIVGPHWATIQAQEMNPRFRDRDFAGGFAAGMQAVDRLIGQSQVGVAAAPTTSAPVQVHVQVPAAAPAGPPPDYSGFVRFLGWLLAIAVLGVIVYVVLAGRARRKREEEERQTAQSAASRQKKAVAARIGELTDSMPLLKARVGVLGQKIDIEQKAAFDRRYQEADVLFGGASTAFADLSSSAADPDRPGRTKQEYEDIAREYQSVLKKLDQVADAMAKLKQDCERTDREASELPQAIAVAESAIQAYAEAERTRSGEGWKTGAASGKAQEAATEFARAKTEQQAKRFAKALVAAKAATAAARDAQRLVDELPARRETLAATLTKLAQRLTATEERVTTDAKSAFGRIQQEFARSSWQDIAGNGSEAERRIDQALEALEAGNAAIALEEQRWSDAEARIAEAQKLLGEADGLIKSITALEQRLREAKAAAPNEINAAAKDLTRAKEYERTHDDDIDDAIKKDIRVADTKLAAAREALTLAQPDYLAVVDMARAANNAADQILAFCRNQHEAAERQRAKAVQSVRDAEGAIGDARRYIDNHRSDVGRSARDTLQNAEVEYERAKVASDLASRIQHAERAESEAKSALTRAKRDFRDAEEERERAAEQVREAQRRAQRAAERAAEDAVDTFARGAAWGTYTSQRAHHSAPTRREDSGPSFPSFGGSSTFGNSDSDRSGGSSTWESSSPSSDSDRSGGSSTW